MSSFTRFNIKHNPSSKINMGYQGRELYLPLSATPFKKAADLYAINPDMTYAIRALYLSSGTYGDQLVAIVNAVSNPDDVFRMALPRKYVEVIDPDNIDVITDCNEGNAKFRITQYHSKRFNKDRNDVEFL